MTAASLGDFETETGCKLMLDCSADPKTQVQVRVELQACHCARALPAEYEAVMEETWLKKVTQNPKVRHADFHMFQSVSFGTLLSRLLPATSCSTAQSFGSGPWPRRPMR